MNTLKVKLKVKQTVKNKLVPKLIGRINFANYMEYSEPKFYELIRETENTSLFKKLFAPDDRKMKVIYYDRFPYTNISSYWLPFNGNVISGSPIPGIGSIGDNNHEVIKIIRKIGKEKFKRFFLFCEEGYTTPQLAKICNLSIKEVKRINDFIDMISVKTEFFSPTAINSNVIHYFTVASIEKNSFGNLYIGYFSPYYARGRYKIDYKKIKELIENEVFSKKEIKSINILLNRLELINMRKKLLFQIIQKVIEKQRTFLLTDELKYLQPYTQSRLAKELNVHPSIICRAICNKSVITYKTIY